MNSASRAKREIAAAFDGLNLARTAGIFRGYEPPLTDPAVITRNKVSGELAPGVFGLALATNKYIYIPLIVAVQQGSGHVGRFLNSLSPRCRIVMVQSDRLRGMLLRRGWKSFTMRLPQSIADLIWNDDDDDDIDVWVRE